MPLREQRSSADAAAQPSTAACASDADEHVKPGTVLDARYLIVREIGRGGMGRVLLAHDNKLDRDVAIKVVSTGSREPT